MWLGSLFHCITVQGKKENLMYSLHLEGTVVISSFTGPYKNVRVISTSRTPNPDVTGITMVHLAVHSNVIGRHIYIVI